MGRHVIHVEGLSHLGQPIPLAVRRGPVLVSGSISGRDRTTGLPPESSLEEIRNAFANLAEIVRAGGLELDSVVKVEVLLADLSLRDQVNEVWLSVFPDEADRPVRHSTEGKLPAGLRIQLSIMAIE
jgi:enamine deaminase RidA (YjgF/YER057c/UK114 family)